MIRVYFINLAIDHLWDEEGVLREIFPQRIPESEILLRSNEDLANYLPAANEITFGSPFGAVAVDAPGARPIRANPFDSSAWLDEAAGHLDPRGDYELWPASLSPVERQLITRFPRMRLAPWLPLDFPAPELNRKSRLHEWAEVMGLPIPLTKTLSTGELIQFLTSGKEFPIYLKYDRGSGGGGNFLITGRDALACKLLLRQLNPRIQSRWLKQELVANATNWSLHGWATGETPVVLRVGYDSRGHSEYHRPDEIPEPRFVKGFIALGRALRERFNYFGPLGLDLVGDSHGRISVVDVNIRWTKGHLLEAAARRLGLPHVGWTSHRKRSTHESGPLMIPKGAIPFLMAGKTQDGSAPREVSYFLTHEASDDQK